MTTRRFEFEDEVARASMLYVDIDEEFHPSVFIKSSVPFRSLPPSHPLIKWMVGNIELLQPEFDGRDVVVLASTPDDVEQYTISAG